MTVDKWIGAEAARPDSFLSPTARTMRFNSEFSQPSRSYGALKNAKWIQSGTWGRLGHSN